jgi:hypothetical protein
MLVVTLSIWVMAPQKTWIKLDDCEREELKVGRRTKKN